jgi:hypothetical protein
MESPYSNEWVGIYEILEVVLEQEGAMWFILPFFIPQLI